MNDWFSVWTDSLNWFTEINPIDAISRFNPKRPQWQAIYEPISLSEALWNHHSIYSNAKFANTCKFIAKVLCIFNIFLSPTVRWAFSIFCPREASQPQHNTSKCLSFMHKLPNMHYSNDWSTSHSLITIYKHLVCWTGK